MTQSKTNKNNIYNKDWSVQISLTGLSFLGRDNNDQLCYLNDVFPAATTAEGLTQYMDQFWGQNREKLNIHGDQGIQVIHQSSLYTLVPKYLYDPSKGLDYLKFNTRLLDSDLVAHDNIEVLDLVIVYLPFTNVNNWFFERFGSFTFEHSITILLRHLMTQCTPQNNPQIMAYLHQDHFDLIVWEYEHVKLCNTFYYKQPEDVLYFVLFACEQLNLNPETIQFHLAGIAQKQQDY